MVRVISSVGRASRLHRECRGFESLITHFTTSTITFRSCSRLKQLNTVMGTMLRQRPIYKGRNCA